MTQTNKTAELHDQFNRLFVMLKEHQRALYDHENPWEQAFHYALREIRTSARSAQHQYDDYRKFGFSVNTIEAEGNLRGWSAVLEIMEYCLKEAEENK